MNKNIRGVEKNKEEIRKMGWKIRYVSPQVIGKHLACYNVEWKGRKL